MVNRRVIDICIILLCEQKMKNNTSKNKIDKRANEHDKYVERFANLDRTQMNLLPGEELAHCIDQTSFGGRFYRPQWVVSNKGRVWSMRYNKWMSPQIVKSFGNHYWGLCPN